MRRPLPRTSSLWFLAPVAAALTACGPARPAPSAGPEGHATAAIATSSPDVLTPVPVPPPEGPAYASGFIHDVAVVYQNGDEHAENVELHLLPSNQMLLAFRAGGTGQTETGTAHIRIFRFDPLTYGGTLATDVAPAPSDPVRGIRDPKLFEWNGELRLGAISRLAGFPIRDLLAETQTVLAISHDQGSTFDVPTPMELKLTDKPFGFWRYVVRHSFFGGQTLYATGYDDGDQEAAYFASFDGGKTFARMGSIVNAPAAVPSEAELNFLGKHGEVAVSLVRLDNQGLVEDGQTAICVKRGSWFGFFGNFDCSRRLEQRLDGPSRVFEVDGRTFVVARKHLACTLKRTAIYEIRGDLADPHSHIRLFEVAELPSNGDTSYAAVARFPESTASSSWPGTRRRWGSTSPGCPHSSGRAGSSPPRSTSGSTTRTSRSRWERTRGAPPSRCPPPPGRTCRGRSS